MLLHVHCENNEVVRKYLLRWAIFASDFKSSFGAFFFNAPTTSESLKFLGLNVFTSDVRWRGSTGAFISVIFSISPSFLPKTCMNAFLFSLSKFITQSSKHKSEIFLVILLFLPDLPPIKYNLVQNVCNSFTHIPWLNAISVSFRIKSKI